MIRLAEWRVGEGAAVCFHQGRLEEVALPDAAFEAENRRAAERLGGVVRIGELAVLVTGRRRA